MRVVPAPALPRFGAQTTAAFFTFRDTEFEELKVITGNEPQYQEQRNNKSYGKIDSRISHSHRGTRRATRMADKKKEKVKAVSDGEGA